jgi:conserved oligomeric Golgi complex subunit 2
MAELNDHQPLRDPFELERLADELAAREADGTTGHSSVNGIDLPTFVPLSHTEQHLVAQNFDVERFLLSRAAHSDLSDLRTELRTYLGALKEELVQLINDDYEAFISLSTNLRGEGRTLERIGKPLGELKEKVLVRVL